MRTFLRPAAVVAIVLVTAPGVMERLPLVLRAQETSSERKPLEVREAVLAHLDAAADRDSLMFDRRTGRRAAWITGRKGSQRLVINGVPGPEFAEVSSPDFSPDGSRIAYRGQRGRLPKPRFTLRAPKQWFVVLDGNEYGGYEDAGPAVFSADSRRVAWVALRSHVLHVIDGVEQGPYMPGFEFPRLDGAPAVFSDDGRHVAFRATAMEGKDMDIVVRIVVDGVAGPPHRWAGRPRFSPDGQHVAYWAREHRSRGLHLILDGKSVATTSQDSPETLERLDQIMVGGGLPFAPDAARLAFVLEHEKKFIPVIHGKAGPPAAALWDIAFSPDFSRSAYREGSETAWSQVGRIVSGVLGAATMMAGVPMGGGTPEWKARGIVVDGVPRPDYPRPVGDPVFSPDGSRLAYPSEHAVVVNGVAGPRYDGMGAEGLAFSSDGRHLAYAAKTKAGWHVVVDDVAGPACKGVKSLWPSGGRYALTFVPATRHVVYGASDGTGQRVVVSGLGATPEYDEVADIVVFDRPGTLVFMARRGDELLRVEVDVPEA